MVLSCAVADPWTSSLRPLIANELDIAAGANLNAAFSLRYARWSLGFVDPPLEVSGTGSSCKISALNARGQILLDPVSDAMDKLLGDGILKSVNRDGDVVEVEVAPSGEVGSFSEEDRSRQVSSR